MGWYNAALIRHCEDTRRTLGVDHHLFVSAADAVDRSQEDCPHPVGARRTCHPAVFPCILEWCLRCSKVIRRD